MRVTVNFYDAGGNSVSGLSYVFAGSHDFWEENDTTIHRPE